MRIQSLFLISFFAVCGQVLPAMAQSDWVSVGEMRRLFFDNYKKDIPAFSDADKQHMALDGEKRNVYIVGCLDEDNTLSVPDIVESLRRQEYKGYLDELQDPQYYMGSIVSGLRRVVWRLAGEEMMSKTRVAKKPKSFSYECGAHYSTSFIDEEGERVDMGYTGVRERPNWTREIHSEMMGLADLVNQAWSREQPDFKTGFADGCIVLLHVSPEGKLDVDRLLPESPDQNNEKVFALLRKVVRGLPPWTMSYLWRADGKVFPGRYLKCTLMPHGVWYFMDYLEYNLIVKKT